MAINIEREFYIPETFDVQRRWKREYNYEKRDYDVHDEYDDEFFLQYVNQKGSTVYYLSEDRVAKSDTYQNVPITGFTIDRNTYSEADYRSFVDGVIIKDPRGFEFQISIRNFLHLTRHHVIDCGEIMAECVLTWSVSGYLTLLSTESDSYKSAVEYTNKQHAVFDPEDIKIGESYLIKKSSDVFVYIGKHKINSNKDNYYLPFNLTPSKQLRPVFYNKNTDEFVTFMLRKNLASKANETVQDVTELVSKFKNTKEGRTFKDFELVDFSTDKITKNGRDLLDGVLGMLTEDDELLYINYYSPGQWDNSKLDYIRFSVKLYNTNDGYLSEGRSDYWRKTSNFGIPEEAKLEQFESIVNNINAKHIRINFEDEMSNSIIIGSDED